MLCITSTRFGFDVLIEPVHWDSKAIKPIQILIYYYYHCILVWPGLLQYYHSIIIHSIVLFTCILFIRLRPLNFLFALLSNSPHLSWSGLDIHISNKNCVQDYSFNDIDQRPNSKKTNSMKMTGILKYMFWWFILLKDRHGLYYHIWKRNRPRTT